MRQAIADYIAYEGSLGRTEQSLTGYKYRLRYFQVFLRERNDKDVREVKADHIQRYHNWLIAKKLKTNTRYTYICTIKTFLHWLHQRHRIFSDLAKRIELPQMEKTLPPTALTSEEVMALLDSMPMSRFTTKRNRAMLEVLYACGVRREELFRLNVGDIDFIGGTLFVSRGKGGKDRLLPIHDRALQVLKEYLTARGGRLMKTSPLFVTHPSGGHEERVEAGDLCQVFQRLNKKSKKQVYPHLLRHTFAVHMLQGGADIRYVQALLGHESADTTAKYLGLVKADIKAAYDAAMERLFSG